MFLSILYTMHHGIYKMAAPMGHAGCRVVKAYEWKHLFTIVPKAFTYSIYAGAKRHLWQRSKLLHSPVSNKHVKLSYNPRASLLNLARCGLPTFNRRCMCLNSNKNDLPNQQCFRDNSLSRLVLGIETSCDDTGAAVVDQSGNILGECLHSQTKTHVEFGGIIPPIARDLHKQNIEPVVTQALQRAGLTVQQVDAIAVTVKPGLALSLKIGLDYAKKLVKESGKPLIPIHHMEAHALTARMIHRVDFPFLVLLVSGGHCLLAIARGVEDFLLLGQGIDDAPGEAFDKTARQMKLKNLPQFAGVSGGVAVEELAKQGNIRAFDFPVVMSRIPSCNFSFSGLKFHAKKTIEEEEKRQGVEGGNVLPNAADICASFQYGMLRHLGRRLQRGMLFCELNDLLPKNKTLVVSGGVASNMFLREGLRQVCDQYSCSLVCPPRHLCTDNGIMIAWNGIEKLLSGVGFAEDPQNVDIQSRCPLGVDISEEVSKATIKLPRLKFSFEDT